MACTLIRSDEGAGLVANGGGFVDVVSVTEGSYFGVELEEDVSQSYWPCASRFNI